MTTEETLGKSRMRCSGGMLIPYIESDFAIFGPLGRIPVRSVCHGPTLNPELSVRAIRLLLEKNGFRDADIRGSQIPLRL